MGDYVTDVTDLNDAFGAEEILQIADLDGDGAVDTDTVTRAITAAEATVNSYLARRYDLASLKSVKPPVVVQIAIDLSYYEIAKCRDARLVGPGSDFEALYQRAIARLREIAQGVTVLDVDTVTEQTAIQITNNDRIFSRDTLKGF